jgi:leucyl aminopeptidase
MKFSIKTGHPENQSTDCLIVGVFEQGGLTASAQQIDQACGGKINQVIEHGDMNGKLASTLLMHHLSGIEAKRVLLVGLGSQEKLTDLQWRRAIVAAIKALSSTGVSQASICLADAQVQNAQQQAHTWQWKTSMLAEAVSDVSYRYDVTRGKQYHEKKQQDKSAAQPSLQQVEILVPAEQQAVAEAGLKRGQALALGVAFTKDLGNLPPNICTPTYLAEQAVALAKQYSMQAEILEKADVEKLGMGSFLGVAQGSVQPPKFIVLKHLKGDAKRKPIVLVGKGITFDTGGISLKPGGDMDEMKFDMCGAASVLGTIKAVAEMGLAANVIGVIPACENMPDGNAIRPGDILTSMSGQTIEVLNTDAEGRLILCDALTYVERFEPEAVVDIATLTGACVIALGSHASGLYSNRDPLAEELKLAGDRALDRAWHMPLWDDYQAQLDSNFADMANIGGRPAGSITAACFLSRYAKAYDWAHLDVAGTASKSGKEKGATGRPVPLLTEFILSRYA